MSNEYVMNKIHDKQLNHFPNVNTLLKISLGLIFLTVLSSTLVYAETFSVDVDGTSFDVDYTSTGLSVSNVELIWILFL